MSLGVGLSSCQTTVEMTPPPQPVTLNYTMLGIWPQRHIAYQVSAALKEEGIATKLSGYQPCAVNVEADRLEQARAIVAANPNW